MIGHEGINSLLPRRQWRRSAREGVSFHQSSVLSAMPGLVHGFTTRHGGCSVGEYGTLNLAANVGDRPENVEENQRRVAGALGFKLENMVTAEQVHGCAVSIIQEPRQAGGKVDALVTDVPDILLALRFADCVPIFLFDPLKRVIGLAHSGWRGTEANVVAATVNAMTLNYGTEPSRVLAAIGPCISFERYEVSLDVAEKFRTTAGGLFGSTEVVMPCNEFSGTYLLNLRGIVYQQLISAGLKIESVLISEQCTFSNSKEFFSHRREGLGGTKTTGRMAAVIGLKPLSRSRGNR